MNCNNFNDFFWREKPIFLSRVVLGEQILKINLSRLNIDHFYLVYSILKAWVHLHIFANSLLYLDGATL